MRGLCKVTSSHSWDCTESGLCDRRCTWSPEPQSFLRGGCCLSLGLAHLVQQIFVTSCTVGTVLGTTGGQSRHLLRSWLPRA